MIVDCRWSIDDCGFSIGEKTSPYLENAVLQSIELVRRSERTQHSLTIGSRPSSIDHRQSTIGNGYGQRF
jgi:hypothetical protein